MKIIVGVGQNTQLVQFSVSRDGLRRLHKNMEEAYNDGFFNELVAACSLGSA